MNRLAWMTCAAALFSMAACGSKSTSAPNTGGAQPAKATPAGAASAEQVAKEMRGSVRCPAKASTQPPAGAPVDDVTGIRPGMSWDEAANFVLCDNPLMVVAENSSRNFGINTYDQHIRQGFDGTFAQPRVVKNSQQILDDIRKAEVLRSENAYIAPLQPGQSRYFVSTMGLPGKEQVLSVAREEYYADGKQPTMDSVKQALIGKYGLPTFEKDGDRTYFSWDFDPAGNRVPQGSQLSSSCSMNTPTPDSAVHLSSDCGVTVGAVIDALPSNPGLAHDLDVMSQDGAQGMVALKAVADYFQKGDEARRAKELNNASKNAGSPKL
jgi:hypothetical protein